MATAITAADLLGKLESMEKRLDQGAVARSRGEIVKPGVFGSGWMPHDANSANHWPNEKAIKRIAEAYNSEDYVGMMVRDGRAKALGWGPGLCQIVERTYPGRNGLEFKGPVTDESMEKDTGFVQYAKAYGAGRKGINGQIQKAAMLEGAGMTGGYLVPPQFQNELLTIAAEDAFIEPRCRILPMTSRTATFPMLDITTVQAAGTTPYYGGVLAIWQPESQTVYESEPQFRSDQWTAWDLQLLTIASNQLLADNGVGLDALLTQLFGGALTWYREYAFLQGMGAGSSMPLGVLNSACTIQVTRSVPNSFKLADIANMFSHLQIRSWKDACWVMHQSVLPQLIQMNAGGTGGFLTWLNPLGQGVNGPTSAAMPATLLGLPIFWTEKLPQLGSSGCVLLADWSRYVIGQRQDMQIDVSREYKFAQNQMTWRIISRCDARSWLSSFITDQSGWQISPFVMLM